VNIPTSPDAQNATAIAITIATATRITVATTGLIPNLPLPRLIQKTITKHLNKSYYQKSRKQPLVKHSEYSLLDIPIKTSGLAIKRTSYL
jgi:hypothetical protein